ILNCLLPCINTLQSSQWRKLNNTALTKTLPAPLDSLNTSTLLRHCYNFIARNFQLTLQQRHSKLLSVCRPSLSMDPILWLPMLPIERSQLIRWRLGWLLGGTPKPCQCKLHNLTKKHSIHCLRIHSQLRMSQDADDPINRLPSRPPKSLHKQAYWRIHWITIQRFLYKFDMLQHGAPYDDLVLSNLSLNSPFLLWLSQHL
ncbi:uncharacterized protein BX663DRAFT_436136, partial [Cokeromyces recurvatus]|uniref:uncharacterized protein n=1 Tax=Cokeromyces recurvatus TaxID=90255 RepID=UPI0022200D17